VQPGLLAFEVIAVTPAMTSVAVNLTSGPHPVKTHFQHNAQRNLCCSVSNQTLRTLGFFLTTAHRFICLITHKKSDN
jgi:putative Mn2+ efflux pump MntP